MPESTKIRIPETALLELEVVESIDWTEGVPLEGVIEWINEVVARFRPDEVGDSTRSSQEFTPRSFRHYQTLGCIDPPTRSGRLARYGFRHYLQGLLVRKLLWERMPSEQIKRLMSNRTNDDYKRLLFEGVELVPAGGQSGPDLTSVPNREPWARITLSEGVELHLRRDRPALGRKEIEDLIEELREQLADTR